MNPDLAKSLMNAVMISARADIAHNLLSAYMRGYYIGCLFAYSNLAANDELRALRDQYSDEVRNACKEAA